MSDSTKDLQEILRRCFSDFCIENSSSDFKSLEETNYNWLESPSSNPVLATLGFAGAKIQGSLYLGCNYDFLKNTHPMVQMGGDVSESDLNDWAGEICNQLVGRLKNIILKSGIEVSMAVPHIITGSDYNTSSPQGFNHCFYRNTDFDGMFLALYSKLDSDIQIDFQQENENEIASEGDAILF